MLCVYFVRAYWHIAGANNDVIASIPVDIAEAHVDLCCLVVSDNRDGSRYSGFQDIFESIRMTPNAPMMPEL